MYKTAKGNWPLYCVWLLTLCITMGISFAYQGESTSFSGIAETREIILNSETAVDIRRIHVTEGQTVKKGDLLVELSSPEMVLKINNIEHQLDELKAKKGVDKTELQSRINQLTAEKVAKENEISAQIAELENQYNINRNLVSDLKSVAGEIAGYADDENSPIKLRIKNLKKELSLAVNPLQVQIELLRKILGNSDAPVEIQIERFEKELELLKSANSKLNLYAQISGIIGTVYFKPGEKASPFAPIATLHTKTPSFIKGYIHENAISKIGMGDKVSVMSFSESGVVVQGQVIGVGARIVEYPLRLRKHPDIQAWGREVMIRIPENNHFILGERVAIASECSTSGVVGKLKKFCFLSESMAETGNCNSLQSSSTETSFVKIDDKDIEASGMIFLKDLQQYLVISDDTPDDKPLVYLVDLTGKVTDEISIEGCDKVGDMESITEGDNGIIYIASSLSANSKGNVKDKRKNLISVMRNGKTLSLSKEVNLYGTLKDAAEKDSGSEWANFILEAISNDTMDVEGMFYNNGALFIGFKTPLMNDQSVIIRIADADGFVHSGTLERNQVSIWKTISLKCDNMDKPERISDLCISSDGLYITGTAEKNKNESKSGSLWRVDETTGTATRLMIFNGRAPEGVVAQGINDDLSLCFDGGSKEKSEIGIITWPSAAGL